MLPRCSHYSKVCPGAASVSYLPDTDDEDYMFPSLELDATEWGGGSFHDSMSHLSNTIGIGISNSYNSVKHKMKKLYTSEADHIFGDDFEFPHGAHARSHTHAHAHANARTHANVLDMPIHMRTPMYHHSSASDTHDMYALTGLHPGRHRHAARRLTLHQRARTVHVGPRPHSAAPPLRTACWTFVSQAAYVCRTRIRQPEAGTPALAARTASQTTAIASVVSNANVVLESQIVS